MPTLRRPIVFALAGSALALALALPVSPGLLGASPALAKDGNGGGNGNSGGNGNGNGNSGGNSPGAASFASPGNSGNAPGHSKLKIIEVTSTSAPEVGDAAAPTGKGKVKGLDGQIGALHAVHANLQAFIHASPNSRVGKIAAYAEATVGVEDAAQALADAQAALAAAETALADALGAFEGSTDLADFKTAYPVYADFNLATLQDRYQVLSTAVDPLTADETTELAALTTVLGSPSATELAATLDTTDGLSEQIDADQAALDAAVQGADDALAEAGNKQITDEVKAYVDAALQDGGILDYYRAQ